MSLGVVRKVSGRKDRIREKDWKRRKGEEMEKKEK